MPTNRTRRNSRNSTVERRIAAAQQAAEQTALAAAEDEIPIRRYTNPITDAACSDNYYCLLQELNQILDHQNEILGHILAILGGYST